MAGQTLAAYNAIAEQLAKRRSEWLKLMDVWEQAQELLKRETLLGHGKARGARRQIKSAAVADQHKALAAHCEAPLDRIEHAHEQVLSKQQTCAAENERLLAHQQALQAAALAIEPYQAEWTAAKSLAEQAQAALPADPLAAIQSLDEGQGKLARLNARAAKILEQSRLAGEAAEKIEQVTQLASQRRSQGFLLRESGADPDPLLAEARQQHAATCASLQRADETAAGAALAKTQDLIRQARQAIEDHVAARSRCENEIPLRRGDARRLADLFAAARAQRMELERDFAPQAWSAVADQAPHAEALLNSAHQLTDEAAQCAAANVQHYLQAGRLLAQAAENHKQAAAMLEAVGKRLRELIEARGRCQALLNQVATQADAVAHLLRSSMADRVQANERFRGARTALDRAEQDGRLPRPDWAALSVRLGEIQTDLERAQRMAHEDIKLHEQAAAELAEAEGALEQAAAFNQHGFTPDLAAASNQRSQARARLAAQDYEQAIRLASAAQHAAREAINLARAKAQQHQSALEAQRLADEAARAASRPAMHLLPAEGEPSPVTAECEEPLAKSQAVEI
jgi:hypothetical protein